MTRFAFGGGEKITLVICAGLLVSLAVFTGTAAAYAAGQSAVAGLALFACALLEGWFAAIVLEEALAAFHLSIGVDDKRLVLHLPKRRGTARLPVASYDGRIDAIAAIERRDEAFTFLGLTLIQRAYRLTFKDGETIILGADRPLKAPFFEAVVEALVDRRGVMPIDLGLVDGAFGFPFGSRVPPWSAPSLDAAAIEARWRGAARALRLARLASSV